MIKNSVKMQAEAVLESLAHTGKELVSILIAMANRCMILIRAEIGSNYIFKSKIIDSH